MSEPLRLTNIDEALDHLRSIESAPMISTSGPWSLHQIMEHCRQSVEYSLDGFPTLKPAIVRRTVGGWAGRRFLRRGHLGHRTDAAIPGAQVCVSPDDASRVAELTWRPRCVTADLDGDGLRDPVIGYGGGDDLGGLGVLLSSEL